MRYLHLMEFDHLQFRVHHKTYVLLKKYALNHPNLEKFLFFYQITPPSLFLDQHPFQLVAHGFCKQLSFCPWKDPLHAMHQLKQPLAHCINVENLLPFVVYKQQLTCLQIFSKTAYLHTILNKFL